jgi:hypothetical protein
MCAKTVDVSQLPNEAPSLGPRTGIMADVAKLARRVIKGASG